MLDKLLVLDQLLVSHSFTWRHNLNTENRLFLPLLTSMKLIRLGKGKQLRQADKQLKPQHLTPSLLNPENRASCANTTLSSYWR